MYPSSPRKAYSALPLNSPFNLGTTFENGPRHTALVKTSSFIIIQRRMGHYIRCLTGKIRAAYDHQIFFDGNGARLDNHALFLGRKKPRQFIKLGITPELPSHQSLHIIPDTVIVCINPCNRSSI